MLVLLQNKKTYQYYYKTKRHVSTITKQKDTLVLLQNKKTHQYYYKIKRHVNIITKQKDMLVLLQNDILVFKK